jgi:small subunit ribosomal protein S2
MLTNFSTISKRLTRLKELEEIDFDDVAASGRTKKELLMMRREKEKLERTLGGIRDMNRVPSAVWVVDTKKEHLAVTEARKLGVPVIAILDTNCDPDEVDYKIPGNDDAIRSVTLLTKVVAEAVADGLISRSSGGAAPDGQADEPMAEWERELLAGSAEPATQEPAAQEADAKESATTEPSTAPAGAEVTEEITAVEDTDSASPAPGAPEETPVVAPEATDDAAASAPDAAAETPAPAETPAS